MAASFLLFVSIRADCMKRWLSIVTLLVLLVVIAVYYWQQPQFIVILKEVSLSTIFLLVVTRFLFLGPNGLFLRVLAARFDIHLTLKEWIGLPFVTALGNYITPFSGGMVVRATYLKKRHDFPYSNFAAILGSNYLISFWVIGITGVFAMLLIPFEVGQSQWLLGGWFVVVVVGLSLLFLIPAFKVPGDNRISKLINASLEGWQLIKGDKVLIFKLVLFTLAQIFFNTASFWLAYQNFGEAVSFLSILVISLFSFFSILINITPSNLGVSEAAITLASTLLGTSAGVGLTVALLIRATTILVVFTLGPFFSYLLTRELSAVAVNKAN